MITTDISAIRRRWVEEWDESTATTIHTNQAAEGTVGPWIRLTINPGSSESLGFGGDKIHQLGRIYIQVFVDRATRDGVVADLAATAAKVFTNWRSDDGLLHVATPSFDFIDDVTDPYFQVRVSLMWRSVRSLLPPAPVGPVAPDGFEFVTSGGEIVTTNNGTEYVMIPSAPSGLEFVTSGGLNITINGGLEYVTIPIA